MCARVRAACMPHYLLLLWICHSGPRANHPAAHRLLTRFVPSDHRPHKSKKFTAKAKDFARAGLVHRPTPEEPDTVQCFTCGKWLAGWEPLDDPLEEHKMHLPPGGCTFIKSLGADKENAVAPSAQCTQEVPPPAVVPEAAAEGAAPLDPSDASSAPSVPAASVPAHAATNASTPLAALSIPESNGNDEDVLDGTTVEGHFKHQSDVQCHRLVRACEAQKDAFQVKASEMRERLVARVEELEMLMTSQMDQ
jgi:hypothetical protein